MAKFTIGGKEVETPVPSFATIKKQWPHILAMQAEQLDAAAKAEATGQPFIPNPIVLMEHGVAVVAYAMMQADPELTVDKVMETITGPECQEIEATMNAIMTEAGFKQEAPPSGEPQAIVSTGTGTASSPNLSPPAAKEEAGTQ
jgi:hypothetical protein